ncbi:MAG: TrmH family RNA methyltransferase [Pseudomonadota bacterium]|nr:TrmH family RNA methyltransferase [Pseudomonadota bacterium]
MTEKRIFLPEIVLVNTQLPENLGATARAMLNFKFNDLRMVSPNFDLSNEKIIPVSAGAVKVIRNIKLFRNFEDSIKDFNILVGTTNRIRAIRKKQINFSMISDLLKTKNKIGIIFGPEKSGLDNNHISMCDYVLQINSNPKFSSLNISHAVAIVCYEIIKEVEKKSKTIDLGKKKNEIFAKKEELINFFSVLENLLEETDFFLVKERKEITRQKIRNIFNKLDLTLKDLNTLLGVIKSLRKNN